MRVKICGVTRPDDARLAAQLGADAIGLVFYAPSPRAVSLHAAQQIIASLPPFVSVVGLFVNANRAEIESVLSSCALDVLQFHGDESPAFCRSFHRPYLKAIKMQPGVDLLHEVHRFQDARGLVLDASVAGTAGGSGQVFDWSLVPARLALPVILAGGLNVNNVAAAIKQVRPQAIDVASGVERSPGVKDAALLNAFISGAKNGAI